MEDLSARKRRYAEEHAITVGELRRALAVFEDDWTVVFSETEAGNPQVFYRTKARGPKLVQIELNELSEEWLSAEEWKPRE